MALGSSCERRQTFQIIIFRWLCQRCDYPSSSYCVWGKNSEMFASNAHVQSPSLPRLLLHAIMHPFSQIIYSPGLSIYPACLAVVHHVVTTSMVPLRRSIWTPCSSISAPVVVTSTTAASAAAATTTTKTTSTTKTTTTAAARNVPITPRSI